MADIASPCTNICRIDPTSALCCGCGRTLEEIARWGTMSESERRGIMTELAGRRGWPGASEGKPECPCP